MTLRVLYVSPHAHLGGAERVTMDLLAQHDRSVVEPSVCFLHDGPLVGQCRDRLGLPTYIVNAPPLRNVLQRRRAVRTIAGLVEAGDVDLVHSVMAWGHLYGGAAAAKARRPAVWFQHVGAAWGSMIEAWASFVPARAIIANSEFTASGQRRVNPRRARVEVIHPGTRIPAEPRTVRRARGREALGIASDEFVVGIVARLQRAKGQDVVIRAAASLLHARRHTRLFVIGDPLFDTDDSATRLPALAKALGVGDRVTFTGLRHDIPDCLAALDVAVHASTTPESFGLGLIEAMAAGTALVAADGGAVREITTPGVDAIVTPPGDHEALATALLALCDDPERRQSLAAEGAFTARERFDAVEMTLKVEELYASLVRR
ncbi:MAG: glycosyltransferase [Gemmatimonadales bacterium]|nr:glycosyltransferase [Gemmatimonadales bacterium]